jgi:hypothetical protein
MMMATSPRVEAFLRRYDALSDAEKSMVRHMVELADRRLLAERLAASVPYEIFAGVFRQCSASRPSSPQTSTTPNDQDGRSG